MMSAEAVEFLEDERQHRIATVREFVTDPVELAEAVERIDADHAAALRRLPATEAR